jgi:hypothetical protein
MTPEEFEQERRQAEDLAEQAEWMGEMPDSLLVPVVFLPDGRPVIEVDELMSWGARFAGGISAAGQRAAAQEGEEGALMVAFSNGALVTLDTLGVAVARALGYDTLSDLGMAVALAQGDWLHVRGPNFVDHDAPGHDDASDAHGAA